jgi:hypothetical protein
MALRKICVMAGILILVSTLRAVEPGLPSKTAVYAAAARAVGAKNPNPELRNPDYLAIKFLGPRERAILADYPMDALDLDYQGAMMQLADKLPVTTHAFRTKAFDAAMLDALKGVLDRSWSLGPGSTVAVIDSSHNCVVSDSWKSITLRPRNTRNSVPKRSSVRHQRTCCMCRGLHER